MSLFIGVDVGTGSARAGVFDTKGTLLASHAENIQMWRDGDFVEQSSSGIWQAVCASVKAAVTQAGITPDAVKGIGFDAACSMVVLDRQMQPLSVSTADDAGQRNVIVWMDHRAKDQAERINSQGHSVLDYVGGRISPEMQTPKLLWLKENLPEIFANAGQFFDLPDFLTWAATGSLTRSACTVTCKWTYLAHEDRWDDRYFHQIGLAELATENYTRIGQSIVPPGTPLAQGLTQAAADQMGLVAGIPVGAALIDAHAGGIGTVGADAQAGPLATMAYVFGTSACTMASSAQPHKVSGVWGPYYSAMVPGLWLSEGGQSAAGEAIAHLIKTHPAHDEATEHAADAGLALHDYLLLKVSERVVDLGGAVDLVGTRLIVPEFLGNRAPHADPDATAVISGLSLRCDIEDLIKTYVAGIFGVGYGLRQIMNAQAAQGVSPQSIVISGGAGRSDTVKQMLADASGYTVLSTNSPEPVLLGAAMLGAMSSGHFATLTDTMSAMSSIKYVFTPSTPSTRKKHAICFKAFEALQKTEQNLRAELGH